MCLTNCSFIFTKPGGEQVENNSRQLFSSIPSLNHEYCCHIWELVKLGKQTNLNGKSRILGRLMLEHPQYQYFWEIPYSFAQTELEKALQEEGVNPDLHLAIEEMIVDQSGLH